MQVVDIKMTCKYYNCSSLSSVVIGEKVQSIGSSAFAICGELADVYCYAEIVPSANADAFEGSYVENATLHVLEGPVEQYKQTTPWSGFGSIVAIGGEEKKQCAQPVISYADGKLSGMCAAEGATCYFATGDAVFPSMDFRAYTGDSDLSQDLQLMIYAYATADEYEKSDVVSKQISVPFGTYVNLEVHDTTYVDVPYEVVVFDTISVPTAQEIPAPTIVVDDGRVEILSGLENAVIYYTLDGTMPTVCDGNRYDGPFTVTGDCTISAIAVLTSEAATKEVTDGIWNRPSQAATYRYYRTNGIETDTPTNGVTIVVTTGADGQQKVTKRIVK